MLLQGQINRIVPCPAQPPGARDRVPSFRFNNLEHTGQVAHRLPFGPKLPRRKGGGTEVELSGTVMTVTKSLRTTQRGRLLPLRALDLPSSSEHVNCPAGSQLLNRSEPFKSLCLPV
jgi:hypothetical protein